MIPANTDLKISIRYIILIDTFFVMLVSRPPRNNHQQVTILPRRSLSEKRRQALSVHGDVRVRSRSENGFAKEYLKEAIFLRSFGRNMSLRKSLSAASLKHLESNDCKYIN